MTEFLVAGLRSVDLTVPDLAQAVSFYTKTWALSVVDHTANSAVLRATGDDHHVLVLHAGNAPAFRSMTFRVTSLEALHVIASRTLESDGHIIEAVGPKDWPAGGIGLAIADLGGCVMRFVYDDERRIADPALSDHAERLAHVNINSRNVDATTKFYQDVLGFTLTDRSKLMAFVRTNSDHHTIVIAEAPVDGLNHIAFMLPDWEGVMRASGRMVDHGFPIGWGVGRHGPGDNVFAYFVDPFGIVIEYTAEVLQVDDSYVMRGPADWVWPPGRTDQWGIAPSKPDSVKAAQLAIMFATPESIS